MVTSLSHTPYTRDTALEHEMWTWWPSARVVKLVITVFFKWQTQKKYALMMLRGGSDTMESSAHSDTGACV